MDVSENWGTDVDTAVDLALAELKATREEVDITVLEQPSRGFFGIGSKLALVRVERKKPVVEEVVVEKKPEPKKVKKERKEPKRDTRKENTKQNAKSSVSVNDEKCNLTVLEDHIALSFLQEVTEQMGLNIKVSAKTDGENIYVEMEGKDSGTIIGKRGQTLDAIQYLTSLVVNKSSEDYVRVVVDAENYRSKREKTLEKLATRLADKVVKTKRSVKLETINPYERKVIHATLQNDGRVLTRSEGQDPYRRVIIELK